MNFLDAQYVQLRTYYGNRLKAEILHTKDNMCQNIFVGMVGVNKPDKVVMEIKFGSDQKVPHKLSISPIQYTMKPFEIELSLMKKGKKRAYKTINMQELRTIFELEPDTDRILFTFKKRRNVGKYAHIKFSVNYIEY